MNILEILHEHAIHYGDMVIWEDEMSSYSFSQIEQASGKVYRYLKTLGIGKEDIVAIRLPRSGRIPIVMLGVWKAGAAFLAFDDHSGEESVSYQLNETAPRLVFDLECYEKAMSCDYLEGHAQADEHDLAFIVYSTGSSGVFKGSMHEYGAVQKVVNRTIKSTGNTDNDCGKQEHSRILLTFGFFTPPALAFTLDTILFRNYFYIVPVAKIGKIEKIAELLLEKKISSYSATSRDLKYIEDLKSPYLKNIGVALDMISCTYSPEHPVTNFYASSESFCVMTSFQVDKSYDITPIGKPFPDFSLKIADKNGNPVADGEIGEICFVPEYWRGYIAQPEKTRAVFYDGWFHTGDMAYVNEDSNMVVVGRKIDMMETPRGIIVPIFISTAFQHAFPNVQKSRVQLFGDSQNPVICLYYCGGEPMTISAVREALMGKIPEYCLPTHCRQMDHFDYFHNGKLNRKSFPNLAEA